ncbi:MAG: PAS domain S-box protein [Gemmatimonadaceae bacterium]
MAVSSVAVALLVTLSLRYHPLFIPAILVTAWYGGIGPGLLAVFLSILGTVYFLAAPRFAPRPVTLDDALYLLVFVLSALFVAWLAATQRRVEHALRQAHDESSARMRDLARANERLRAEVVARERAEQVLEQRERRFRALIERSSDAVLLYTPDGTIVYASPAVERILGYTPEELIGRHGHDLVHPDHRQDSMERREALVQRPYEAYSSETLVRRKDGAWRWLESTVTNLVHEPGVQAVVANFRDVTERKQAEYLTSQVFECSPDSVAIVGRDYRFQRVNPTVERRYGIPAEKIVGMHVTDIIGVEAFEQTIKPRLDRCFAGEDVSFTTWMTNTGSGRRFYAITYSPLRPDPARVDAALATTRDLTEHLRASEALQESQAELARVTRVTMLGEITASLAHEVSQPLAAVVMNGNACRRWLAADPPNLDEAREAARRIISDGERAGQVIGRIRALVRRATPAKSPLDVNGVVEESLGFTRSELERKAVSIRTELQHGLPPVMGDRVQLQQVLINLVLNGVDAMAEMTGPRVLTVRSRREDPGHALVEVADCGKGLGARQLERMFDAFFSTKPAGLGMGLSVSRSVVEAHGGRIWATPNDGAGVTMRFTLPFAREGA